MKKTFTIYLLLFLNFVSAQNLPKSFENQTNWQAFKYDMSSVGLGIGYAFSRPIHWKGKQWLSFAGIAAGTTILTFTDDEFNNWADTFRNDIPKSVLNFGGNHARPEGNYALTGAVYFTGLFTKNEKLRRTGVLMMASTITGGFLQQLTVRFIGRARPLTGKTSDVFTPFRFKEVKRFDSFFSGHTVLSFTNAYAIAKQFKNPWVKAGIYTVGMVPGFTRIVIRKHWFSDVAFGTLMSILIVESIDKYLDIRYREKYNKNDKKVNWDLTFAPGQIGLNLSFN